MTNVTEGKGLTKLFFGILFGVYLPSRVRYFGKVYIERRRNAQYEIRGKYPVYASFGEQACTDESPTLNLVQGTPWELFFEKNLVFKPIVRGRPVLTARPIGM